MSDYELIVVDDGSGPEGRDFLSDASRKYGIEVLRRDNSGPAAARNYGAHHARGDYLAFMDADDYWHPDKLHIQLLAAYSARGQGLILNDTATVSAKGVPFITNRLSSLTPRGIVKETLLGHVHSFTSSLFLRRDVFLASGGFCDELRMREDHLLLIEFAARSECYVVPEILSFRRSHPTSYSHGAAMRPAGEQFEWHMRFFEELRTRLPTISVDRFEVRQLARILAHSIVLGRHAEARQCGLVALRRFPTALILCGLGVVALIAPRVPGLLDWWNPELASCRLKSEASSDRLP